MITITLEGAKKEITILNVYCFEAGGELERQRQAVLILVYLRLV